MPPQSDKGILSTSPSLSFTAPAYWKFESIPLQR